MLGSSQDVREPDWSAAAEAPALSLVVAMEPTLHCPVGMNGQGERDASALRVIDALVHAHVRLIVLSQQSRAVVDGFRTTVPRAMWTADSGDWLYDGAWSPRDAGCSLASWIDAHCASGPVMAIGDGILHPSFAALAPFEVGVTSSLFTREHDIRSKRMSGPSAVRALLWWLVQERSRAVSSRGAAVVVEQRAAPARARGLA
jgi:hypothetical protein